MSLVALMEKKDVIVMMDTNNDTFNSKHNKTWNVDNLKQLLFDFMNIHNITIHNKKVTHFSTIHDDSCIDHVFSNCNHKC